MTDGPPHLDLVVEVKSVYGENAMRDDRGCRIPMTDGRWKERA